MLAVVLAAGFLVVTQISRPYVCTVADAVHVIDQKLCRRLCQYLTAAWAVLLGRALVVYGHISEHRGSGVAKGICAGVFNCIGRERDCCCGDS